MVHQPASAQIQTRVIQTGAHTTAVASQNFLRASARSKTSLTQIDSLRASYPLKLLSPSSVNTSYGSRTVEDIASIPVLQNSETESGTSESEKASTTSTTVLLPPAPRIVYMITYGGGLLADDHPDLDLVLTRHARLLVLGQGNTKIYKSPRPDYPPCSQTLHSTVGPGALLLFLGPAVVACEDSSVFLRHEILLQAQRRLPSSTSSSSSSSNTEDEDDELPSCVVLDWIAGGRGEEERWKARRSEWRMIVRWAELEPEGTSSQTEAQDSSTPLSAMDVDTKEEEEEEEEFVDEEDPRDVADRLAGGPVIFRDGFLIEHNPPLPKRNSPPTSSKPLPGSIEPKMTSYAPALYPHSTIGSLFIMGPKTERLQRSILKRFEQLTIYPGQYPEQRADYPILWSATVIQIPRPSAPNSSTSTTSGSMPRRKKTLMKATVVKMASQGVEQMQDFLKSLFEEQGAKMKEGQKLMDSDDEGEADEKQRGRRSKSKPVEAEPGLSVVDELFGGRAIWERAFR
ncbi:urease accessory protein [Entomortierella parvispora]|uniref:Urease accessory protein n=1 Tax=Entomortierella parvispora TaxID=205924 RepID=A0A9P3HLD8_9FUNG|nr:urease accessory protein [Entomortierella parvispora]